MIVEKIKITREQEEKLKIYKFNNGLEAFLSGDGWLEDTFPTLKNFTPEQFALLLCGWYEVEQPFKVGDWVVSNYGYGETRYLKVSSVNDNELEFHTGTWGFAKNYLKVEER